MVSTAATGCGTAGKTRSRGRRPLHPGARCGRLAYRPIRNLEDELPDADPGRVIVSDKDLIQELADRRLAELAAAGPPSVAGR
jgi:hypothetical protein